MYTCADVSAVVFIPRLAGRMLGPGPVGTGYAPPEVSRFFGCTPLGPVAWTIALASWPTGSSRSRGT